METLAGGVDPCFWGGVGFVLGTAAIVLSGGAAAPAVLAYGAGVAGLLSACSGSL